MGLEEMVLGRFGSTLGRVRRTELEHGVYMGCEPIFLSFAKIFLSLLTKVSLLSLFHVLLLGLET